jgi:ABC-type Fe3+-hydroxamate transport system substrate-binding protein
LVPSQTELLYDLGLDEEVAGITKFCVHPPHWLKEKTIIGGTKKFHFEIIDRLRPDLIIGNKEENYREGIELLQKKYPVWMSDIITLDDALSMITSVSEITGRQDSGACIVERIRTSFKEIKPGNASVLYLIWKKPWMGAGKGTFINSMLEIMGLENVLQTERYPELSEEEIKELHPEVLLLSSEPYPFREEHIEELKRIVPKAKIILVDGEIFSWYGSRLLKAPDYFKSKVSNLL